MNDHDEHIHHFIDLGRKFEAIIEYVKQINHRITHMSAELDALNAAVAANTAAVASVGAEVASLKAAQGIAPADVQAAADQVAKNNADLAALVPAP